MTALEFLARLRQLPASTPLSLPHVAAALEMLSSVLARQPNGDVGQRERWTDEAVLAQWLGEPVGTVEGWRLGATSKQPYRLGAVVDWLDEHMVTLMGSEADTDEDVARIAAACRTSLIPALEVDGHLIGFFRSLHLEMEPQGYVIVQGDDLRALETARLTPRQSANLMAGYQALAVFAKQLSTSPSQAMATWRGIRDEISPDLALQFFLAAIGHDYDVAMEILASLDEALLRSRWHLGCWLWELLLNHEFRNLNADTLLSAFTFAGEQDISINTVKGYKDSFGYPVFNGTSAHLLADTYGDHFRLNLRVGFGMPIYEQLLCGLLERGLDVEIENYGGLTALGIGEVVQGKYSTGSEFCGVLNTHTLRSKLESTLDSKAAKPRKQPA
ncbi:MULTISPECIES: hypothetical protein [Ralstonia]|jgi:hypothetical protein|uniref:Uncharacterized protein n=1 Tax=Ralstonia pickettii OR214 TaxID=1264675 RepID=R0DZB8_RALPI|nr:MULTISPECIES: hypothetical protein [Ralstonia]ENZ75279.1 hypothetical protein OR214_04721 [Ralstonia pickettii OR214]MCM3583634.1 hypothetical protein [Ralstonia pickettii]MEA3270410.1 hypothetical protein [Pseudomonadota bacterium]OYU20716.1 MAG: hypothetical protein CFE42_22790 [Ralstonia sp. PBBBR1]